MINKMREMAPTIMLIILVTFVGGTIFLDWGMNVTSKSGMKTNSAGKVNGKEIPLSYIDRQVNAERQKLQSQGGNVPPYQYRMIPQKVWEQEVNRVLMQDVFKKMDIGATGDEIFEYIKNNPLPGIDTASVFQTNGVFDTSKYVKFLSDPKSYEYYSWLRDIENYTKEMIIPSQKLEQLLLAGTFPTKSEIEFQYSQDKQKLVFEYLKVNSPMISVDESKITDEMMKKYYEAHRDSFATGEQAEIYFVKYPKLATANDDQVYLQEMKELKGRIESTGKIAENFAEEAKTESDDEGSAVNGGDLGWFTKGQMVPQFDSAAFSMDTGKISEPVKTQFGYHLIFVEAKEMKGDTVKVKARHILRKIVPTNETLDQLSEHADSLKGAIINNGNFLATTKAAGVLVDSTGLYKKGDMIPKIGYLSGAGQFVFHHDKKDVVSERLENDDAYYLIALKQILKKGIIPYEAAREKIKTKLTDSLRQEAAREYAQSILSKLSDTTSLASLKNSDPKITAGVTDTVAGSDYIPGIGYGTKVAAVAMAIPVGKRSNIIDFDGTCYIVKTLWRLPVEKVKWDSPEAAQSVEKMKQQLKQKIYYDWYNDYKSKAKVESNIENIYVD
jgi:peptidyl-prolyl cis-trans isomerase D